MSEEDIEVKMTSGLPKGHVNNGLASIAGELVERPASWSSGRPAGTSPSW